MSTSQPRHMIRLEHKPQLFSFRVAALIFHEAYLLVNRSVVDRYWALPGGRAEIGESTEETILREIEEELHVKASIERLVWSAENFFAYGDYQAHEMAFYYQIRLEEAFPFHENDIIHRVADGGEVEFRWLPATVKALRENDLRPAFIADSIETLPERHQHVIVREGE
ncbi:8-oxo-dGTP pyrophosphatase MutT (NUDIX family) [Agrobacterium larrymoorei]|uniref:8-oxo-dGTP pyrophosphatase MutT (NUDIX family) n=1 Tax=Agrobacterium larrymoorei TaxID=160699 RepID=A0AAJ2BG57_9HYPH|nr:NUDIX domain-containing protein [Agrobacterium larrymoorei]MDR6103158.1 8-oxo-dGTP pyrophosphatase MutT (NUDIX family) [Agrobacterium larrymoorei]